MSKKFILLSGALKNAGDFLITDRSVCLIKSVYPDCSITIIKRNKPLNNILDTINQSDALVLAGGPAYTKNVYPKIIPLVDDLNKIKVKICEMGLGAYNKNYQDIELSSFFEAQTSSLLQRIYNDSGELFCRDWFTAKLLKRNGFKNIMLTGCPAWYSPYYRTIQNPRYINCNMVKKICISDSAYYKNHSMLIDVVKFLRKKFQNAELHFVFHRGIFSDEYTDKTVGEKNVILYNSLKALSYVNIHDISYSGDGFKIYNDCDFHIGYRVHAHIYNLSIHNISLLIGEDSRGISANETLGCLPLSADSDVISLLDNYIDIIMDNKYIMYDAVYSNIEIYRQNMINHIKNWF